MAVVVVGAGLAGVACGVELAAAGVEVRVLERARTVGGRMASRRIDGRPVDLGAAYFTVSDPAFAQVVARWRTAGLARPWTTELAVLGGDEPGRSPGPVRWAAPGGLRSLVAALAEGLPVELEHEVTRVGPGPTVDGEPADAVVLAMPDPQARRLLAHQPRHQDHGELRGDGAPVLVVHTTDEVARRHDAHPADAVAPVLDALRGLLGVRSDPVWTHAHRWRFSAPAGKRDEPFHLGDDGVALAGDSWGSSRVETAWTSGTALGRKLVERSRKLGTGL